jgi:hypothetical protein
MEPNLIINVYFNNFHQTIYIEMFPKIYTNCFVLFVAKMTTVKITSNLINDFSINYYHQMIQTELFSKIRNKYFCHFFCQNDHCGTRTKSTFNNDTTDVFKIQTNCFALFVA